jgi:hypothetical protein
MLRPNFSKSPGPASRVTHSFNLGFPVNVVHYSSTFDDEKAGKKSVVCTVLPPGSGDFAM